MEQKTDIHAVELVRQIRDKQAKQLQGKGQSAVGGAWRGAAEDPHA